MIRLAVLLASSALASGAAAQTICGVRVPGGAAPMSSLCEHEQFERLLAGPPRPGLQARSCHQGGIRYIVLTARTGTYAFDMTTPNPGIRCPGRSR